MNTTTHTQADVAAEAVVKPTNFLRHIIETHLADGTHAGRRWGGGPGDARRVRCPRCFRDQARGCYSGRSQAFEPWRSTGSEFIAPNLST